MRILIPGQEYPYLHENTDTYTRTPMEIIMVYYTQLKRKLDVQILIVKSKIQEQEIMRLYNSA